MRKLIFQYLLLPCLPLGLLLARVSAQSLLVVNQGDTNLSIVDPVAGRQVATIDEKTTGVHGHEIAASADGRTAFVPIYGSTGVGKPGIDGHDMLVIDLPSRKIVGDIDFGHGVRPHLPVLDPVSGLLYVTTELDKTVSVIDPKTRKIVGAVPTGQEESHMLALSHDGHRGYTANVGPGTVSVLDMMGRRTVAIIPVSKQIQRISISADDKLVFTSDVTKPQLAVIDTATNKVKTWIALAWLGVRNRRNLRRALAAGRCAFYEPGSGRGLGKHAGSAPHRRCQPAAGNSDSSRRQGRVCIVCRERASRRH